MEKLPCAAGQSLPFLWGDEKGFEWIGVMTLPLTSFLRGRQHQDRKQDRTGANAILELLADGKRMPSAELEKTVNEAWDFLTHHEKANEPYRGQTCDEKTAQHGLYLRN
jgi:hypothetical protein